MPYSPCSPGHSLHCFRDARLHSPLASRLAVVALAVLLAGAGGVARAQSVTKPPASAGDDENAEVVVLPEFAVTTSTDDSNLRADETLGAMRISTPLIESPITVTVLKPEFIQAFMLNREDEQSALVAGGNAISEWQGGNAPVYLRGFSTAYYRNGFQRWGTNATVNIERIEYIKGPLASTFGRSNPGGIVNYITRRAQRRPAYETQVVAGSYDYQDIQVRATGPVAKNLFYRTDFQYRYNEGEVDFMFNRMYAASASITWEISKNTSWMFDVEHRLQTVNWAGSVTMRWNAGTFLIPGTSTYMTESVFGGRYTEFDKFNARGPDEWLQRKITTFDTRFEHRFNRWLSFRLNGQYWSGLYERWGWGHTTGPQIIPTLVMNTGLFSNRIPIHEYHPLSTLAGQADLLATFKIGPTSHKLLLTADASDYKQKLPDYTMSQENIDKLPYTVRNLSLYWPDYGGFNRSLVNQIFWNKREHFKSTGVLLSDRMQMLGGRVQLYGSLRFDDFYARFDDYIETEKSGELRTNMFNGTYGGVVHIIPGRLVAFANYSSSFTASTVVDSVTGKLQDPITGRGIEAGARGEVLKVPGTSQALYWSASFYRIDRKVPQRNPYYVEGERDDNTGLMPEYINTGIERVDGVELEVTGNISKQVHITLAYTKLDAYLKRFSEEPEREGVRILGVPTESMSCTARYKVTEGPLVGFSAGFIMMYNSEYFTRYGMAGSQVTGIDPITNKLRLHYGPYTTIEEVRPAVTIFDIYAEYQFKTDKCRHTIGFNIKNLNDTIWYSMGGVRNPGRQLYLRYRLQF